MIISSQNDRPVVIQVRQLLACGNYMIFYHTGGITVMMDRVFYGRRDYLALLFSDILTIEDE